MNGYSICVRSFVGRLIGNRRLVVTLKDSEVIFVCSGRWLWVNDCDAAGT